jgi:amidohydrolase
MNGENGSMKNTIIETIDSHARRFTDIARFIGSHPELGDEEFLASSRLAEELEWHGFAVERQTLGIPTAFLASYASGKPGPIIAFLCEYDALPDIGHGCGHHLIAAMSLSAAVGLKSVIGEIGGTIRVYGTPAEETRGAKVTMAAAGLFKDVNAALMTHPYHSYVKSGSSLAMDALQFDYFGKPAHAAASPQDGINALDAVIQLFNSVNALRQQLPSHVRIHGIIANGGKAANIIPDFASAQFYVRAASRPETDRMVQKVLRCAEGAALQTGCKLEVSNYEYSYDELVTNSVLSDVFTENLLAMGVKPEDILAGRDNGSVDLGNVSRQCPTVHPYMKVTEEAYSLHTKEFCKSAMKERAMDGMLFAGKTLALTAYDIITRPGLLRKVREEFEQAIGSQKT